MSWSCQLPSCNSFTHHMHILFTWETPLVNPWPPVHLFWLQPLFITFHHRYSSSPLSYFHLFLYTINRFVFCETGKIDNLSAVGGKVFWLSVCAGPRLLKIKRQRSSAFTLLFISRSYWFDKPRFDIEGKLLLDAIPPSLGAPPNSFHHTIKQFSSAVAGYLGATARGVWHS